MKRPARLDHAIANFGWIRRAST